LGSIQYIDYFGNLIADIPAATVKDKLWQVVFGDLTIPSCSTYGDRNLGELMAIIGSHGWVEVAVNCGNAREILKAKWNDRIRVEILD
jgi:S-adenosylmethionine hydrolase